MSEPRTYLHLIGGEWVPSQSGATYANVNPADTRDVVGYFQDGVAADIDAAVRAAAAAYEGWRLTPAPKRGEILFRAAELLVQRKEEYAQTMTREMGKVLKEARGDVQEAIDMTYFIAGEGRRLHGQTTPSEMHNKFQMSIRVPLGVCGLITPWNFPMAIPSWKLLPALILGNTVVIKPAEDTPLSTINFVQTLIDAGLPPGVVNIVTGDGPNAGEPLARHPDVKVVSFTGSTATGQHITRVAGETMKRVSLEMGGKNAIIVLDDADLDLAVEGAVWGAFGTTGQRCTASSRIIAHRAVADALGRRLAERASAMTVGSGLDEATTMGPSINQQQFDTVLEYVQVGKDEGATVLTGGARLRDGAYAHGFFHEPTVFGDVAPTMRIAQEEIFGPVTTIIPVDGLDEAVQVANGVKYGLSASIYTRDVNAAFRAMRDLDTGIVYVNAPTIGAEIHLPFGGTKATGNGHREGGIQALDVFGEWKSLYIDFSGALQRAQIDNAE